MALRMSVQFPITSAFLLPTKAGHVNSSVRLKPPCAGNHSVSQFQPRRPLTETRSKQSLLKAVDESQANSESGPESVSTQQKESAGDGESAASQPVELSELGKEIKEAMQKRKEEKDGDFLSGVADEVREIEWPAFAKVLGTTGVVLGVIAGSSVVLLTVNAVLAEFSDQIFAGKGIQDFFS
ncbi:hypothetical protein ACE6H2_000142 [Prunus campanulata]